MKREILLLMLRKEIRSASRNRRLVLLLLIGPLMVFPVLIFLPPILANPAIDSSPVLVINLDAGSQGQNLSRQISLTPGLMVRAADANASPQAAIQSGLYDVALVIPANFTSVIANNQTATLQVYYDGSYSRSTISVALLSSALLSYSQQVIILRNQSKNPITPPLGVTPISLRAIRPLVASVANILPALWSLWAILAGGYIGLDVSTSESNESTLPVLLASPNTPFEILAGKVSSLMIMACFAAMLAVVGVYAIPTLGVMIGSGLSATTVAGSIPLSVGVVGAIALSVVLSFALSALVFGFLGLFLMGAGRLKIAITGVLGTAVSTLFLMSTSDLNMPNGGILLPFLGSYILSIRAVNQVVTLSDIAVVGSLGVLFGLALFLFSYREIGSSSLLLRGVFAASRDSKEEIEVSVENSSNGPKES